MEGMNLLRSIPGGLRFAAWLDMGWMYVTPVSAETLESIKQSVRKRFPSVRQITTGELAAWLSDSGRVPPLLVDVRETNEFVVSHLRGALNLSSLSSIQAARPLDNRPVVVYCSVGYRSSALAEKLQRAGLTNVVNLEGSIFAWANEGRPLYRGTNEVREVHGYSSKWRQLLHTEVPVKL